MHSFQFDLSMDINPRCSEFTHEKKQIDNRIFFNIFIIFKQNFTKFYVKRVPISL